LNAGYGESPVVGAARPSTLPHSFLHAIRSSRSNRGDSTNTGLLRSSEEPEVIKLETYGWSSYFAQYVLEYREQGLVPARVLTESKNTYRVVAEYGEYSAELAGRVRFEAPDQESLPAVGDWVAVRLQPQSGQATVHAVLPRKSQFTRKAAGARTEPQVVAANIDLVFLVMGLDGDFNLRRLERYLTLARQGGVAPVVVLNKADLCADVSSRFDAVRSIGPGLPVFAVSAHTAAGMGALVELLKPGETIALLGSSGVGKSSLTNLLSGSALQHTNSVRESDSRGRHTTTRRDLILLPGGTLLIDTPGMRELQLWSVGEGLDDVFDDVRSVASACRFRDCRHETEPGCAIGVAIEDGMLDPGRFRSYITLRKEAEAVERRQDAAARRAEKARWKSITKSMRNHKKGW
jgi:ribosome biogenesis GTPase / thiamine phosphate phosphatase